MCFIPSMNSFSSGVELALFPTFFRLAAGSAVLLEGAILLVRKGDAIMLI